MWLFSSGPVGDPLLPEEEPVDVSELMAATRAREHRIFAGELVKKRLSFPDRAIATAFRANEGDVRDWTEIAAWGASIADALASAS